MPPRASLIATLLSHLRTRWAEGWRMMPDDGLPRLIAAIATAFAITSGLVWGLTRWAQYLAAEGGLQAWDQRAILAINGNWNPFGFTDGIIFESPANLLILIPVTLIAAALAVHHRRLLLAITLVANYVLARPLIWLGWHLWDRARPHVIKNGAAALSAHSFPSGHAILCVSGYGLLLYVALTASRSWPERVLLSAFFVVFVTFVVGSRLLLGAHWPSDVIAGALIGAVWLTGMITALRFAKRGGRSVFA